MLERVLERDVLYTNMNWTRRERKKFKGNHALKGSDCSSFRVQNGIFSSRVLVIDANKLIRWSLKEIFTQEGIEVDDYPSAEEALQEAAKSHYDLIITDLGVKRETEINTARKVINTYPSTPMIILSSHGQGQLDAVLSNPNIFSVLEKPFRIEQIRDLSKKALALSGDQFKKENVKEE